MKNITKNTAKLLFLCAISNTSLATTDEVIRIGKLDYATTYSFSTPEAVRLITTPNPGDVVPSGDPAIVIDNKQLETDLDLAQNILIQTGIDYQRSKSLEAESKISKAELERSILEVRRAKANTEKIRKRIEDRSLNTLNKIRILNSPFENGDRVQPNTTIVEYVDFKQPFSAKIRLLPSEFATIEKRTCTVSINLELIPCYISKYTQNNRYYEVFLSFENDGEYTRHEPAKVTLK